MNNRFSHKTLLGLPLAAMALAVSSAYAAPVQGPTGPAFYTAPSPMPTGNPGELISYRTATVNLGTGAPAVKAWNVLYQSLRGAVTKATGEFKANVVSGTVFVPQAAWTGGGIRPVILYAVGTHGLAQKCAPSRQFEIAGKDGRDYETANIVAALNRGYTVLVTDYDGYLSNTKSTYIAGESQGHAVLDILEAAASIPGADISIDSPAAIWGYSQGGQSAAWAAEVAPTYAPNVKLVGAAAGGIPADLFSTARLLNKNNGFAFLASAIKGLSTEYPNDVPIGLVLSNEGQTALDTLTSQCVFESLFKNQNRDIAEFTWPQEPGTSEPGGLEGMLGVPIVAETLEKQTLGKNKITVPLYHYHGRADEFIPLNADYQLKKAYCAKGTNVTFDLYPSEHIVTQFQAAPKALDFLADRFAGKAVTGTCNTTARDPVGNAEPGGGDLVVAMDKWALDAQVHLKLLNSDVILPAASTFTAKANVTKKTLNGSLSIPNFNQKVNLIGLKLPVGLSITSAGPVTGSVDLDYDGVLHVNGKAPVDITITSLVYIPFGACKTEKSVDFPLVFDGPLSSLGNGKLTFTGTVAFPKITGCQISGTLSAFMSGNGQTFKFTVSPPAPVKN